MRVKVKDVMSHDVACVTGDTTFKDIAELLIERAVGAVPVVDEKGKIIGLVSETDLLRKEEFRDLFYQEGYRPPLRARLRHRLDHEGKDVAAKARGDTAADLMTTPAVTATPTTALVSAVRLMDWHGVRRLPVVDEANRVVGMISRHDVLKVFVRPDEEIAGEIRDEVLDRSLWTDTSAVEVAVRDGVVTLSGRIRERSNADIAVRLTQRVNGVVDVVDRLQWDVDDDHGHWLSD